MNISMLQKNHNELDAFIKKANRKLFELEIFQSEWEYKNGKYKVYKSADHLIRRFKSKLK